MTVSIKRAPRRTCVGCRKQDEQHRLLRVVGVISVLGSPAVVTLQPDSNRRKPGRGAYVHRAASCVQIAEQRRAFARALRLGSSVDTTAVTQSIEGQWIERQ